MTFLQLHIGYYGDTACSLFWGLSSQRTCRRPGRLSDREVI